MITNEEIRKFANILDKEYAKEIKPILVNAHTAINEILDFAHNEKNRTMARMCGEYEYVRFEYFEDRFRDDFIALGYTTGLNREIRDGGVRNDIPSMLGYLNTSNHPLSFILFNGEKYRGENGYERRLDTLRNIKTSFNEIREAYNELFVAEDGKMFKYFAKRVLDYCSEIKNENDEKDKEFRALFAKPSKTKRFRVKVIIDEE